MYLYTQCLQYKKTSNLLELGHIFITCVKLAWQFLKFTPQRKLLYAMYLDLSALQWMLHHGMIVEELSTKFPCSCCLLCYD